MNAYHVAFAVGDNTTPSEEDQELCGRLVASVVGKVNHSSGQKLLSACALAAKRGEIIRGVKKRAELIVTNAVNYSPHCDSAPKPPP